MPIAILIVAWYIALGVATFATYAADKSAARQGRARCPERILHLLSAAGGWPAALAAQSMLRHKSRKRSFRAVFWGTVMFNCALLAAVIWSIA